MKMPTVPPPRIIAVSPDQAIGQQLATAFTAANGVVEVHATLDALGPGALQAALCVSHGERVTSELLPRLTPGCAVIAMLPPSNLATVVDLMQSSDQIAGMVVSEGGFDPHALSTMATRIVADDMFGVDKVLAPGTEIHSHNVGDYREKSLCMSAVSRFVDTCGVPRKHRIPIEQCIDEMLMNALYDAPVDADGNHIFSGITTRKRITMRSEQSVVVQYGFDGKQFAVAVRDAFGSLERKTVLRFLDKSLHSKEQVDRKAGGAGLGLYLMVKSSTAVYLSVLPGIATEALCVFDVASSKRQLEGFGFFIQRDPGALVATGPSRRLSVAPPRRMVQLIAVAIAALVVVLGIVAWPRIFGGARPSELPVAIMLEPEPVALVELDSQPDGASVEIDGTPMGSTPLTLTSLVPGATVSIVFKRLGYRTVTAPLEVPRLGESKKLVQPLVLSDDFVRVKFVSTPPGAEVHRDGELPTTDKTYTPAELFVEVNKLQKFTLIMAGHVPLVIEPFTPARGDTELTKGGALVEE